MRIAVRGIVVLVVVAVLGSAGCTADPPSPQEPPTVEAGREAGTARPAGAAGTTTRLRAPGAGLRPTGRGAEAASPPPPPTLPVRYRVPVDAPVSDPFRPPPRPWLAGNRGVEFATAPGMAVRAAGPGIVRFAGPVAGTLHVTIGHTDGVRTSYSFLARVLVRRGQVVPGGAVIGTTDGPLHVGARRDGGYIDPESLWGRSGPPRVHLVPLDGGVE